MATATRVSLSNGIVALVPDDPTLPVLNAATMKPYNASAAYLQGVRAEASAMGGAGRAYYPTLTAKGKAIAATAAANAVAASSTKSVGGAVVMRARGATSARNEQRLAALEKLFRRNTTAPRTPASKNAERAARLIACPDELPQVPESSLPTIPSSSSALRYSHKATGVAALTLDNFNMFVQAPGQTLWCLRNSTAGTNVKAGDLIGLNMGRADFTWTTSELGVAAVPPALSNSRRLVPGYHAGYQASSTTGMPMVPTPVQYTTPTAVLGSIWFLVKDGAGNYGAVRFYTPVQFLATIIGDCTVTTTADTPSTTYPLLTTTSNGVATTFTPIIPTTGAPVRDMLQLVGAAQQAPGDTTNYPNITVASNIRLQSMASALAAKFAVVSYALGAGREGVFNAPVIMDNVTTTAGIAIPVASLASRARQHSMGVLDPDNDKWYAINMATRLASSTDIEAPVVTDFACIGSAIPPETTSLGSNSVIQPPTAATNQPCNLSSMGWGGGQTASIHLITNGATSTPAAVPVEYELTCWLEAYVPPDTGLHTSPAMYHADFINWLQAISTYPVLACADSFKDYLKMVWSSIRTGARVVGRHVYTISKNLLRDAAVEAIIKTVSLLA